MNSVASTSRDLLSQVASAFPAALLERIARERVIAVITLEKVDDAAPLAQALVRGGVRAVELAWRTPQTLAALRVILSEVPEMLVGIGTLLTEAQVRAVADSGAHFGVSPGFSATVVNAAQRAGFAYAPGVQTASDMQAALEHGCTFLKFFPAESAGGVSHLRSLNAPFAHLGLRYLPLGGIDVSSAAAYLSEPAVAAVGGSWIAPSALVRQRAWDIVAERAAEARIHLGTGKPNFA